MSQFATLIADARKCVDLDSDRILAMIQALEKDGATLREPALKRVPAPFDKDHPAATLLRMKGAVASKEIGTPDDLAAAINAACRDLWPLNALLIQIAEA